MDAERRVLSDAAIAVNGDNVAAIGKTKNMVSRFADADRIFGRGMVAIPGLIDAHCHADQSLLRGRTDDLEWIPFLRDWIDPYLARRHPLTAVAAYRLSMLEMIRSGTTCFVSPNVDPADDWAALVDAIERFGGRAVLAYWTDSGAPVAHRPPTIGRWDRAGGGRSRVRVRL